MLVLNATNELFTSLHAQKAAVIRANANFIKS